jgi:soluble lytic murein transglycosylase-like protein
LRARRWDDVFARYGGGLPVAYLRALAIRESDLNPADRSGPAWGLLQVAEVVRRDYNKKRGTSHTRAELLDPRTNVTIASDLLRTIIASYRKHHSGVANLQLDWGNPRFVELLTYGWNAGFSERGGVGRVVRYLKANGATDITIDTVHANAVGAGASRHLARADKVRWCKGVAALFQRERTLSETQRPVA